MYRLDLSGSWLLTALAGTRPDLLDGIPANLPGDNLSALSRAGLVEHPYYGTNELGVQWVGRTDWQLERTFEIETDELLTQPVRFRASCVDTVAEIAINGTSIGTTDNMFVPVDLPVETALLKKGTNTVSIVFSSPERVARDRAQELPYPIPHAQSPVQSPHRNLLRKVQCHSGWDWGPCLMVCGVYGDIELIASSSPTLLHAPAMTVNRDGAWSLVVEPWFVRPDSSTPMRGTAEHASVFTDALRVSVLDPDGREVAAYTGEIAVSGGAADPVELRVDAPRLWWPNGFGEQPLYTVVVEAFGAAVTRRVGFRTIEVARELDTYGESFTFVVNGVPIFAKGANWIPQDALPGLASEAQLRWLLESSREANMNMIRVWGGGTYESDRFYELCDELGLLVWQDFMFACGMYPAGSPFLASVRDEVTHQVLRLKDHPSIALWCGNNENLGALSWFAETKTNRDRYVVDYDRLNEGVVGDTCRKLDPSRLFWPSSPTDGPGEFTDSDDGRGDIHYWSVWHGGEPFSAYRSVAPRFCSEFGFQSFPSLSGVHTYAHAGHHNVTAPEMEHHQRHPKGNAIIMHTMARYYRFPESFAEQLYLSQVQQAHAIRTAVEYWRTRRPRSMGALVWQLNDVWPVSSWSSIEYGGKWKLLHYAEKRFFAPVLVAAVPVNDVGEPLTDEDAPPSGWDIYVVNDSPSGVSGSLLVRVIAFDGTQLHREEHASLSVPPLSSEKLHHLSAARLPADPNACFALAEWGDRATHASSCFFLDAPKRCGLSQPAIATSLSEVDGTIAITLETDVPAFDVALDLGDLPGRFSDNMVSLIPGEPTTLHWIPVGDVRAEEVRGNLTIRTLNDIGREGEKA
ncbi:MAG: beta-mannosidase [Spirochaetota bacterium]